MCVHICVCDYTDIFCTSILFVLFFQRTLTCLHLKSHWVFHMSQQFFSLSWIHYISQHPSNLQLALHAPHSALLSFSRRCCFLFHKDNYSYWIWTPHNSNFTHMNISLLAVIIVFPTLIPGGDSYQYQVTSPLSSPREKPPNASRTLFCPVQHYPFLWKNHFSFSIWLSAANMIPQSHDHQIMSSSFYHR